MHQTPKITPTFEELVADLPQRSDGASPSGHAAFKQLRPQLLQHLDDAAAARAPEVTTALSFWTRNNDHIRAIERLTTRAELSDHFDEAYPELVLQFPNAGDKDRWLDRKIAEAQGPSTILKETWPQAPLLKPGVLGRGGVMPTIDFDVMFKVDEPVTWPAPAAMTVEADFVPLHFVWKNWTYHSKRGARSQDLTAYVLRIEDEDDIGVRGHWVARIDPPSPRDPNFEWQAEIVTAPGLRFEVTRVEDLGARWGRLCRVHAKLRPPLA